YESATAQPSRLRPALRARRRRVSGPRGALAQARWVPPRTSRARPPSVRAAPRENGWDGLEQDAQVERERPVLEVDEVEVDEVVEVELRAAGHLPQAGDAGEDEIALAVPVVEHVVVAFGQRTWADERHLATKHVDELRELVQ